jgi:hypothetical protein
MNSSQKSGKSKSSKSSSSKSKKGGNFLGSVSELFVPTGWENFATAAGLLALDRADAVFRRGRNSTKKQKGGAEEVTDGHVSINDMKDMMQTLGNLSEEQEPSSPDSMSGGANKKKTTGKTPAKKTPAKKTPAKKTAAKKTTKTAKKLIK